MSVSKLLTDLSWLLVDRRARALAFIGAAVILLAAAAFLPRPVDILARMPPRTNMPDADRAASALARALISGSEIVVLAGGSSTREFTPDDLLVSARLSEACGRPLRFVNVGGSNQKFSETWAFAEFATQGKLAAVVVGMNYLRFEEDYVSIAKGLESMFAPVPRPASLAWWLTWRRGHYIAPSAPLRDLARAMRHAVPDTEMGKVLHHLMQPPARDPEEVNPFHAARNFYREPVLGRKEKSLIIAEFMASRVALFRDRWAQATEAWLGFSRQVQAWHAVPIYLILPADPAMRVVEPIFRPTFDAAMDRIRVAGGRIADLRETPGLQPDHFYDQQHLVASGRRAVLSRLLSELQAYIPRCGAGAA